MGRKRKLDVAPGKSISAKEVEDMTSPCTRKTKKKPRTVVNSSSDEIDKYFMNLSSEEVENVITENKTNSDGYLPKICCCTRL